MKRVVTLPFKAKVHEANFDWSVNISLPSKPRIFQPGDIVDWAENHGDDQVQFAAGRWRYRHSRQEFYQRTKAWVDELDDG
jgi:hypothetical protein